MHCNIANPGVICLPFPVMAWDKDRKVIFETEFSPGVEAAGLRRLTVDGWRHGK